MEYFAEVRWSPYVVGIGIGLLSGFTFFFSKKPIACSSTFARAGPTAVPAGMALVGPCSWLYQAGFPSSAFLSGVFWLRRSSSRSSVGSDDDDDGKNEI